MQYVLSQYTILEARHNYLYNSFLYFLHFYSLIVLLLVCHLIVKWDGWTVKKLGAIKVDQVRSSCETWLRGGRERSGRNTWSKGIKICSDLFLMVSSARRENTNYANLIFFTSTQCVSKTSYQSKNLLSVYKYISWATSCSIGCYPSMQNYRDNESRKWLSISHDLFFFAVTLLLCRKYILYIQKVKQINQTALPHSHIMS